MKVWVTRAEPGASATAGRLVGLGHTPLVAPLLAIRPLPFPPIPSEIGALAFTSANGLAALAGRPELERLRGLPVFAVGDATAEAARALGFVQVRSAAGDVAALSALIGASKADFVGPVLHLAAAERSGELNEAGVPVLTTPVYEALELPLSDVVKAAWAELDAVLVHSPRAARVLARVAATLAGSGIAAVCISEAAAAALPAEWGRVEVADAPTEAALLARLGKPPRAG